LDSFGSANQVQAAMVKPMVHTKLSMVIAILVPSFAWAGDLRGLDASERQIELRQLPKQVELSG
jgi:hypothetical protein